VFTRTLTSPVALLFIRSTAQQEAGRLLGLFTVPAGATRLNGPLVMVAPLYSTANLVTPDILDATG
jgi:hypothetical protein